MILLSNNIGDCGMNIKYESALSEFVQRFKSPICTLLNLPEDKCTNSDAVVLVSYLIGHKIGQNLNDSGRINVYLLGHLKDIPQKLRTGASLDRIAAAYDRSVILGDPFTGTGAKSPGMSQLFTGHLLSQRQAKLRSYFHRLHDSVNRLNRAVSVLPIIISDPSISNMKVKACIKEIRMSIQSCEFHLKSGIAMALANDVHPNAVWKASHGLYELRASRLKGMFEKVDSILLKRNIKSSLGSIMSRRQAVWGQNWRDIFELHRLKRNNNNGFSSQRITGFQR
jgi:hypothetical protein